MIYAILLVNIPIIILSVMEKVRWEYVVMNIVWYLAIDMLVSSKIKRSVSVVTHTDGREEIIIEGEE